MKTKHFTHISLFMLVQSICLSVNLPAQNCPVSQIDLEVNRVKARLPQGGYFWTDFDSGKYQVPSDHPEGVSSIFTGSFWIGGIDPAGNLKIFSPTYGNTSGSGSGGNAGPLVNGVLDPDICDRFDRFWEVTRAAVEAHQQDFADNGIIDSPDPAVMGWPGRGNPESKAINGFDLPDVRLAPFVDLNQNGLYEPLAGDYPDYRGDKSIWWMYNGGMETGVNFSVLAYAFETLDEPLTFMTFYDVRIENAGFENLDSTFIGLWVDVDLGCYTDDYVGCLPAENIGFVYNQDEVDGEQGCLCSQFIPTYCNAVPIQGFKFLKGASGLNGEELGMTSFMYFANPSVGTPPPPTTGPSIGLEYYRALNGFWPDGNPITVGGNGYMSGTEVTSYAFAGNPAESADWTMCSSDLPPNDVRLLMNSGPFDLQPGGINEISVALFWISDQDYPCPDTGPLIEAGNVAEEAYQQVTSTNEMQKSEEPAVLVYPNPWTESAKFEVNGPVFIEQITLLAPDGRIVFRADGIQAREYFLERNRLSSGMYFYNIVLHDGSAVSGKMKVE